LSPLLSTSRLTNENRLYHGAKFIMHAQKPVCAVVLGVVLMAAMDA